MGVCEFKINVMFSLFFGNVKGSVFYGFHKIIFPNISFIADFVPVSSLVF